jgi:hypothetical protein
MLILIIVSTDSCHSSVRKRLTHECCINEGVSQSYVGKRVVSLLSIPTMGDGEGPTIPTMGGGEDLT